MRSELFFDRTVAEVELSQIKRNYKIYGDGISEKALIAVVKADAYGHGDLAVCGALCDGGADFFAVSNIDEAVRLRRGGIKGNILVLGYTPASLLGELAEYRISQAVVSEEHLNELENKDVGCVSYHVALDLGMRRIGLCGERANAYVKKIKEAAGRLKIEGVFTHLPSADCNDAENIEFTRRAVSSFDLICESLGGLGIEYFHCQNSAAGLAYNSKAANAVRLGISLYGYSPSGEVVVPEGIRPALAWKSRVCRVFSVKKGESVGYGRSFFAEGDMKVATVTVGYADGYPRALSNEGYVLINGSRARIVGRICMDMMMVDASTVDDISVGQEVVLIGESGGEKTTADDLARGCNTISYEILCGISKRVKRIYI